jgi:signal transduction histidine kinase
MIDINMPISSIILTIILTLLIVVAFLLIINFRFAKKPIKELDFRSVAVHLISLTIWVILLGNIVISYENGINLIIPILIFIVSIVVGILLIRSIFYEIQSEKTIRDLVNKLQKNNSKLKLLNRQKTEFVSLASHQLRGPMVVIRGYASLLLEGDFGKITKKQQTIIERILRSSEALGFLISDYLEVARIEKGEMEYVIEDVDLTEIISSLSEEFSIIAKSSGLNINFSCDLNNEVLIVRGDKAKMRQIFSSLIDNAIKYTKNGSIDVKCSKKDDGILVRIKDTGIGISPERIEEIFSKFIRTPEAKKMNVVGNGLGLFIAKVMTNAQEGKMWVESDGIGKGATFSVWFPSKD